MTTATTTTSDFFVGANVKVRTYGGRTFPGTIEAVTPRTVTIEFTVSHDQIDKRTFRRVGPVWCNAGVWL